MIMKVTTIIHVNFARQKLISIKNKKLDEIQWVDITDGSSVTKNTGKKSQTLLRRLHVEENGKLLVGQKLFSAMEKYAKI